MYHIVSLYHYTTSYTNWSPSRKLTHTQHLGARRATRAVQEQNFQALQNQDMSAGWFPCTLICKKTYQTIELDYRTIYFELSPIGKQPTAGVQVKAGPCKGVDLFQRSKSLRSQNRMVPELRQYRRLPSLRISDDNNRLVPKDIRPEGTALHLFV